MSDSATSGGTERTQSIGRPLARREDERLLTGRGRYLDDIQVPGCLHACFVRSPHAHARIDGIDAERARSLPGVVAVVTGQDLDAWTSRLKMAPPIEGLHPMEFPTLPIDKVRFHGDPVACVVATDAYLAEDAAEAVAVDYTPLEPVVDIASALSDDAPRVADDVPTNLISHQSFVNGDPDRAFANADEIVESTFSQHRQTHAPIETRGCLAQWDEGRQHLTFQVGAQVPHPMRTQLAGRLGLSESQVTVLCPDVGGAFGQKIALFREELTVAAVARALNRPVRWREDRMENLMAASHAREDFARTRAAVTRDGRIQALRLEIVEDFGAYAFFPANYIARVIALILTGPYDIQDYGYDVRIVLTNKCGSGPMRAPMAATSWIMEGTLDDIARRLGLDPVDVRRRNLIRPEAYPYRMPTGEVLEDVTPDKTMEGALERFGYDAFRRRQADDRARGVYRGIGICNVIESTTYGSAFYKSAGIPGSGHESAWVKIEPSGAVNASVGLMGAGQGYETVFAQVVADGLGVAPERVTLQLGNTDIAPYGMGTRGSRGGAAGGGALFRAARRARDKILAIAAAKLSVNDPQSLGLNDGRIEQHRGDAWTDAGLGLADIARTAYLDPLSLPDGMEPGLEAHAAYDPPPMTYSNATHLCEVEVDVETGHVTIARYLVAEDCGTVLNPLIIEGQQHGAIAMGLGGALLEHVRYDESGQNTSATFADYLLASAGEIPDIEVVPMHTPNRKTPTGSKGMAEGGVMGAIGALSNAVSDALAPFGVVVDRQPLSPDTIHAFVHQRKA